MLNKIFSQRNHGIILWSFNGCLKTAIKKQNLINKIVQENNRDCP